MEKECRDNGAANAIPDGYDKYCFKSPSNCMYAKPNEYGNPFCKFKERPYSKRATRTPDISGVF